MGWRSVGRADRRSEGFERLAEIDNGIILGQLAIPAVHAAADLAMRARAARDRTGAEAAVAAARDVIDRYRASTARLTEQDELAAHEIGWRMALCAAELSRAAGEDDPANWEAMRPALSARPAPFLEAYVLWRAAEARAGGGETAAAAGPLREGYEIAAAIGAPLLVARIEGLGRRLRVELGPMEAETTTDVQVDPESPAAPADPFGLTSANGRSWPSWPRATRTGGSPTRCSSARARRASTSRTSSPSSTSSRVPRQPRLPSGSGSTGP